MAEDKDRNKDRWKREDPEKRAARHLKFEKEHLKQVKLALNENTDADIIAFLDTIDNKRAYLLGLIRADMSKRKSTEK